MITFFSLNFKFPEKLLFSGVWESIIKKYCCTSILKKYSMDPMFSALIYYNPSFLNIGMAIIQILNIEYN